MFRPVLCKFDAAAMTFTVADRYRAIARGQFADGEEYPLEVREHRSSKDHAHYFACINEAWQNLDEKTVEALKTPDHLRRWALVQAGWYDELLVEAETRNSAMRMAAMARRLDDYAEISVVRNDPGWLLRVRTAKSQSLASMNKEDFRASKRDVLDILSGQIHVTRRELEAAGKRPGL